MEDSPIALETGVTYIQDLVSTNPSTSLDNVEEGAAHHRLTKVAVQGSFPNLGAAAVTKTAAEINDLVDKSSVQTITGVKTLTSPVLNTPTFNNATINGSLQLQSAVVTTSGTSVDIASIPSWVKRITVMFDSVSSDGTSNLLLQIGDAGGIETSGYKSAVMYSDVLGTATARENSNGYILVAGSVAAQSTSGCVTLTMQNASAFTWALSGSFVAPGYLTYSNSGLKSLSAALTQIRLTTVNGTDAFDAGEISVMYE